MAEWWEPVLTDEAWCARVRADYARASSMTDDEIRREYADGQKYAVTWDNTGDAYDQFERLADAYLALRASDTTSGCPHVGCTLPWPHEHPSGGPDEGQRP